MSVIKRAGSLIPVESFARGGLWATEKQPDTTPALHKPVVAEPASQVPSALHPRVDTAKATKRRPVPYVETRTPAPKKPRKPRRKKPARAREKAAEAEFERRVVAVVAVELRAEAEAIAARVVRRVSRELLDEASKGGVR